MKVLFHCHTDSSNCSDIRPQQLVEFLNVNNFDAIFVTDHNSISDLVWPEGVVIPSSEISTAQGDVIGIFIQNDVPKGLTIKETSEIIHRQGGLVVAAHPCDKLRKEAMGTANFIANLQSFDIVETHNSRNLLARANREALELAKTNGLPAIAGADAHVLGELRNAYMNMPQFSDPTTFLQSLKSATFHAKGSGIWPHLKTFIIKRRS